MHIAATTDAFFMPCHILPSYSDPLYLLSIYDTLEKVRWKVWIFFDRGAPVRVYKKNTKDTDLALAEESAENKEENSDEVEGNKYVTSLKQQFIKKVNRNRKKSFEKKNVQCKWYKTKLLNKKVPFNFWVVKFLKTNMKRKLLKCQKRSIIPSFHFRCDAELDVLDRSKVEELRTGEEWFGENSHYRNINNKNPTKPADQ